jgi:hypothetical protein
MRFSGTRAAVTIAFVAHAAAAFGQQHPQHHAQPSARLGKVHFETSCAAAVRDDFDRAVAMLHSFWYDAAALAFDQVMQKDPTCAMTQWGVALSRWGNPLGGMRNPKIIKDGWAAIEQGRRIGAKTDREKQYIEAAAELYKDGEAVDQRTRAVNYEKAMERLAAAYPNDTEAAIFYAIALVATQPPGDKTYANLLKADGILEPLYKQQPEHPGLAHYIIHALDVPALAPRAKDAAFRYAKIAPDAPHALHMPSHTFTRLGYWQDSIDANLASAEAAKRAGSPGEELHAFDYQVYAFLQQGRDDEAKAAMDKAIAVGKEIQSAAGYGGAGYYAYVAIPARYTLERSRWADAAALPVPETTTLAYVDAMTHFARAYGAARAKGDLAAAKRDVERLAALRDALEKEKNAYWQLQVEIQRLVAEAWIAKAEGDATRALATMKSAADLEDTTEKSPISPGPIVPARESYGEMLLELNRPADALAQFEATMTKEPNRFRGVYGGAKAAKLAGDQAKARRYAAQLQSIAKSGAARPELKEVRSWTH